ncbi:MAG: hypothetical protein ABEH43_06755 [Flavobacteriales bacterium]
MSFVFISGEDELTRKTLKKIIENYCPNLQIFKEFPTRGNNIFPYMKNYNKLSEKYYGFVCCDLDDESCPTNFLENLDFGDDSKNENLIINIAVTEVENWLMSDRINFSNFLSIPPNYIPLAQETSYNRYRYEISTPVKPSLFIMNNLAPLSNNDDIINDLTPINGSKKGPAYNYQLINFVQNNWSIEEATNNSSSLYRCVQKIIRNCQNN